MDIFVMHNGAQVGPFTPEVVVSKMRVGEFSRADAGWHEGLTAWYTLEALLGTTGKANQGMAITGVAIPFRQMVNLIFTFFIASIPALIALFVLGALLSILFGALLAGMGQAVLHN